MAKVQVSSILRALQILECFMDRETEWTLKELVGPSGSALYHGVPPGVHVGGAAVFGAGPCPQELSGGHRG